MIGQNRPNVKTISFVDCALDYRNMGYPVIPINPVNKKPFIGWNSYKKNLPTTKEIKHWWEQWPEAMIGVITGKLSNLTVIDCDSEAGIKAVEEFLPDDQDIPRYSTPLWSGMPWLISIQLP